MGPPLARADPDPGPQTSPTGPILDNQLDAAEADGIEPRRKLVDWHHYEGLYITARLGGGFLYDYAAYAHDTAGKEQMTLSPADGGRDFRLLLKGRFPTLRRLSYTLGYMYDGAAKQWRFRQTGLLVDIPELLGQLFLGRTKRASRPTRSWSVTRAGPMSAPP